MTKRKIKAFVYAPRARGEVFKTHVEVLGTDFFMVAQSDTYAKAYAAMCYGVWVAGYVS